MSTLSTPANKPHKKPLCEQIGHAWELTTSPNFRTCSRSHCRVVQRFHNGQWLTLAARERKQAVEQLHESLWG